MATCFCFRYISIAQPPSPPVPGAVPTAPTAAPEPDASAPATPTMTLPDGETRSLDALGTDDPEQGDLFGS